LSLLRDQLDNGTFLVLNGDVLTDLNISGFLATHREHSGPLTIATALRSVRSDFGVIEQSCGRVICFREKPNLHHLVSMGIYCMEPAVLDHIPVGVAFGFDDLMFDMLKISLPAHTFLHSGFWLDIGRVEDFQKAQELGWDDDAPAFDTAPMSFEAA
jgi:mannose-1-phosphate guanylyltransferase